MMCVRKQEGSFDQREIVVRSTEIRRLIEGDGNLLTNREFTALQQGCADDPCELSPDLL
jgi:hypothetical protein